MNIRHIVKKPIITEKSVADASKGVFTFEVDIRANKNQIKEAIASMYKVDVTGIRTSVEPGKRYRVGQRRQEAVGTGSKKARVALKPGQKITIFELEEN